MNGPSPIAHHEMGAAGLPRVTRPGHGGGFDAVHSALGVCQLPEGAAVGRWCHSAMCLAAFWPVCVLSCHGGAPMLTSFGLVAAPAAPPATPPIAAPATTPTGPPTRPTVAPLAAPAAAPPSARSGCRVPQAANRVIDKPAATVMDLPIGP